jgi:hypothetical protein
MGMNLRQRAEGGLDFVSDTTGTPSFSIYGGSTQVPMLAAATAITAFAGGGQTNATQLSAGYNRVTTVVTAADSVKLPVSVAGMMVAVTNSSANSMQVFGTNPDTINAVATATGVALAAGKTGLYFCPVAGAWHLLLSA